MKILVISAHADDAELGVGGTIAKHADNGDEVRLLIITHSGYSDYDGNIVRTKETAKIESDRATKILGIKKIDCLNYETKKVFYNVELIEDINKYVDSFNPDIIYTHWEGDINQDHEAIAKATFVGARKYNKILKYKSNWHTTNVDFKGNFFVDITNQFDRKMRAIAEHKSEVNKRGNIWQEYFKCEAIKNGIEIGVEYAEKFEIYKWLYKNEGNQ